MSSDGSLQSCEPAGAIASLADSLQARRLSVFYGAGLSFTYPALLPMAVPAEGVPGLCELLLQTLLETVDLALPHGLETEVRSLSLEVVLDYFSRYLGPGTLEFYDVLRSATYSDRPRPNLRHAWLALLAERSLCNNFLTVNFDDLDVSAFRTLDVPVQVPEAQRHEQTEKAAYEQAVRSSRPDLARIFKLHGMLEPDTPGNVNLLATVERVGSGLPPHKCDLIEAVVESHDLLFFGYSDRDIDVFPTISRISSSHRFFWFELEEEWMSRQVLKTLASRQGLLFVGDPDVFLLELLNAVGLDPARLFNQVGCSSLEELHQYHAAAIENRAAEIRSFQNSYAEKFFPDAVPARLLLGNMIIEARWGYPDLLAELVHTIPRTGLEPQLEYAREKFLAEYHLTIGELIEAYRCRTRAITAIQKRGLSGSLRIEPGTARVEQEAWGFLEAARIVRRGRGSQRLRYLLAAVVHAGRARWHLTKRRSEMRPIDAGTFIAMLQFGWGNLLQTSADALLLRRIASPSRVRKRISAAISTFLYRLAERIYRRGLSSIELSDHWRFLLRQRVAETLVHQSGRAPDREETLRREARELLDEADTFFGWGRASRRGYMDVHRALERIYSGEPEKALTSLERAHGQYERNGYLAGMAKCTFYMALANDLLGRRTEVVQTLEKLADLRARMR